MINFLLEQQPQQQAIRNDSCNVKAFKPPSDAEEATPLKQSVIEQKAEKKKQASQAPTNTKRARSIRFSLDSPELHDVKQLDE